MTSVWNRGISGARRRLQDARAAFHGHAEDCARWSYEDPDGHDQQGYPCDECVRTREALKKARESLRRFQPTTPNAQP